MKRFFIILVLMVGLAACGGRQPQKITRIDQRVNPECLEILYPAVGGGIEINLKKMKGGERGEEFGAWTPGGFTPWELKYINGVAVEFGCDCRFKQVGDTLVIY